MASTTVEDKAEKLLKLAAFYQRVVDSDVPDTLDAALAAGWELAEDFGGMPGYSGDERKADGQRVIALSTALRILSDYEEAVMESQVRGTLDIIWQTGYKFWAAMTIIAQYGQRIWEGLIDVWNIGGFLIASWWQFGEIPDVSTVVGGVGAALSAAWAVADDAIGLLLFGWREEHFRRMLVSMTKVRDTHVQLARKRALPQVSASRLRRRKVARL
ncbi:MAG TPA: hypothetical protein VK514_13210 [Candidatus Acidoferrum sp.]|nr:hypothetical protein [Candidatus Acidoferrum sp.]